MAVDKTSDAGIGSNPTIEAMLAEAPELRQYFKDGTFVVDGNYLMSFLGAAVWVSDKSRALETPVNVETPLMKEVRNKFEESKAWMRHLMKELMKN